MMMLVFRFVNELWGGFRFRNEMHFGPRANTEQATTEMNFDPSDPDHLCAALCAGKRRSPIPDIHPPSHRAHT